MKNATLTPDRFEAVLQYALSFGAYQATSGTSSLAHAREAWEELERLGTPMYVREYLETQVGRLP
jgi:hypothetical protein